MTSRSLPSFPLSREQAIAAIRKAGEHCEESISWLNSGGCGVFALAVATELERVKVRHSIVTFGTATKDLTEGAERLAKIGKWDSWYTIEDAFGGDPLFHVAVRIGAHNYDSTGEAWQPRDRNPGFLPLWALRKWVEDTPSIWNSMFDRNQIPAVQRIVRESFAVVAKRARKEAKENRDLLQELYA